MMSRIKEINSTRQYEKMDFSSYTYVIVSTENQIVNYIPWVKYGFRSLFNLTLVDDPKFHNEEWDQNLKRVVKKEGEGIEIQDITFNKNEFTDLGQVHQKLRQQLPWENPIFWNITGGQRAFIVAVFHLAQSRKNDVIAYLEGGKNEIIVMQEGKTINSDTYQDCLKGRLDLEKALQLKGFKVLEYRFDAAAVKEAFYSEVFQRIRTDASFKQEFIKLNQAQNNTDAKRKVLEGLEEQLPGCQEYFSPIKIPNGSSLFGEIWESAVYYFIRRKYIDRLLDIKCNVKISFTDAPKSSKDILDEFDVLALSEEGEVFNLECKTGGASGDNMKSHHFSTFATAGIYSMPILVTPLSRQEIALNDKKSFNKQLIAVKNAKMARVEVWSVDEIEKNMDALTSTSDFAAVG